MRTLKKGLHTALRCVTPILACLALYEMIYLLLDLFVPSSVADTRAYFLFADIFPDLAVLPAVLCFYRADFWRGTRGQDRSRFLAISACFLCAAGFLGVYLLVDAAVSFSGIAAQDAAFQEVDAYFDSLGTAWNLLTAGIAAPVLEELLFRGVISNRIREDWGRAPAVIGSALLFGIYHGNLTQGVVAFVMGIFLAWAYLKTEALFLTVLMHAAVNVTAVLLPASGGLLPDTPEADAALLALCVVFSVLFLRFLLRAPDRQQERRPQ